MGRKTLLIDQLKEFKELGQAVKVAGRKCGDYLLRGRVYYHTIYDVIAELSKDKERKDGKRMRTIKYVSTRQQKKEAPTPTMQAPPTTTTSSGISGKVENIL